MILALIQARMGSTRYPEKVLVDICGKPNLWHHFHRLSACKNVDKVAIATSSDPSCDPIVSFCEEYSIPYTRGDEDDLLDRLYQSAKHFGATDVIRVTGDCPLVDPEVVDRLVSFYQEGDYDFAANNHVSSFPHGLDAEIFSFRILEKAWKDVTDPKIRAFATFCLYHENKENKVGNLQHEVDLSSLRLTFDYPEDIALIRRIFEGLWKDKDIFVLSDILRFLKENPELAHTNDMHKDHHRLSDMESYLK